jgi:hypothetical protein
VVATVDLSESIKVFKPETLIADAWFSSDVFPTAIFSPFDTGTMIAFFILTDIVYFYLRIL